MKILNLTIQNVLLLLFILTCLAGCEEKEKFSLNATEIILHRKQTFTLFDPAYAGKCVCTSENENIASISGDGVITGELVGETNIRVKNTEEGFDGICKVIVNPQYEMYREPYLYFGNVKNRHKIL